jgi:hypothetical protein
MAFSSITNGTAADVLKSFLMQGTSWQMKARFGIWDFVKAVSAKDAGALGKDVQYHLTTGLGLGAIQSSNPGSGNFPKARAASGAVATAYHKAIEAAVSMQLDVDLMSKGEKAAAYIGSMKREIEAKTKGMAIVSNIEAAGDGTGRVARLATVAASSNRLRITIDTSSTYASYSNIAWVRQDDEFRVYNPTTSTQKTKVNNNADTVDYFKVYAVTDRGTTRQVDLTAYTSADVAVNVTAVTHANDPEAGDVLVRRATQVPADWSSITDYGTASSALTGLLAFADGESNTVQGIAQTGLVAPTVHDCETRELTGAEISDAILALLRASDRDIKNYPELWMNDRTYIGLMKQNESAKEFSSSSDATTGFAKIGHEMLGHRLNFSQSVMIPEQRILGIPKGGDDCLVLIGSDFEEVNVDGQKTFLQHSSTAGEFEKSKIMFYSAIRELLCKQRNALLCMKNFSVPT